MLGVPLSVAGSHAYSDDDLVGYWPLQGDAQDYSGNRFDGVNHGVDLRESHFDGRSSWVEIADRPLLNLAKGDFTLCARVHTSRRVEDVIGVVLSKYDPGLRRGFSLGIQSSSGGYNSRGTGMQILFDTDDGRAPAWKDCGRPNPTSNYVSNSLTVFEGSLYAATTDDAGLRDWCHVYRYAGNKDWEDCGRVGELRTRGVGPMIVHGGCLYAATWSYDWTRVDSDELDDCRVYRYEGAQKWTDCGQPGHCRRLFSIASYQDKLYVVGDDNRCHVHRGGKAWQPCGEFPFMTHPMAVHDGRLYAGVFGSRRRRRQAEVYAYDGASWVSAGAPMAQEDREDQIHALEVYRGRLHATTWPSGKVAVLVGGKWESCGRLGRSTEINALTVYNGKLYGGTIPLGEVYRYEGKKRWNRLIRFCPPEVLATTPFDEIRWGRVTSLTGYSGKLFAGIGSYTSSVLDAPADRRGRVYAMQAGQCVSLDQDPGASWKHLAAVRRKGRLELFVEGKLAAEAVFSGSPCDLSNAEPLRIGLGPTDYFSGKIQQVRFYRRALTSTEIGRLAV